MQKAKCEILYSSSTLTLLIAAVSIAAFTSRVTLFWLLST